MGSQKNLDPEALQSLIQAVNKYQEELYSNYNNLKSAAEACDQAMGSGAIIQHYLSQYNEGLSELNKTISLVAQVKEKLQDDWKEAISIKDELGI